MVQCGVHSIYIKLFYLTLYIFILNGLILASAPPENLAFLHGKEVLGFVSDSSHFAPYWL